MTKSGLCGDGGGEKIKSEKGDIRTNIALSIKYKVKVALKYK